MPTAAGAWVLTGGAWKRKGRADRTAPVASFALGDVLVEGVNVGVDPAITLTDYTGPGNGGTVTVTTANTTYTNQRFTNTLFKREADNLRFVNCEFIHTGVSVGTAVAVLDFRQSTAYTQATLTRCTITSRSQWAPSMNGVLGEGFKLDRCVISGFVDAIGLYVHSTRPDGDLNVDLLGVLVKDVSFWWAPTEGVVHSGDTHCHADVIQWQGGKGLHVEGCDLRAHYSLTVGTGTPNSGSDTAGPSASSAPYTQAEGVAARYEVVEGSGLYSPGQPGALLGGSIAGIMLTPVASRGFSIDGHVYKNNRGSGGAYWCNGGSTDITGTIAEISGNKLDNDQRHPGRGFVIHSGVAITNFGSPANTWNDGSGTITRRTG